MTTTYDPEKLRKILEARNLKQTDLQRLTLKAFPPNGVSLSSIRQFFSRKKTKNSGAFVMWKIAHVLGVSVADLARKRRRRGA